MLCPLWDFADVAYFADVARVQLSLRDEPRLVVTKEIDKLILTMECFFRNELVD